MQVESNTASRQGGGDGPPRGAWWRRHPATAAGVAGVLAVLAVVLVWFQPQALLFDTVVDEAFPSVVSDDFEADSGADPEAGPAADRVAGGQDAAAGATNEQQTDRGSRDDEPTDEPTTDDAMTDDVMTDDVMTDDAPEDDAMTDDPPGGEAVAPTEPVARASGDFSSRSRYTVSGDAVAYELPDGSRTLRLEDFTSTNGPDLYVYLAAGDAADDDATLGRDTIDLGVLKGNVGAQNYAIPADVDLEHYDTAVIWCLRFTVGFGAADLDPVVTG